MLKLRKNKKGFTLVELIVVIAIMAVLAGTVAGVTVSQLNKQTDKSNQSQAKGIADFVSTYVIENDFIKDEKFDETKLSDFNTALTSQYSGITTGGSVSSAKASFSVVVTETEIYVLYNGKQANAGGDVYFKINSEGIINGPTSAEVTDLDLDPLTAPAAPQTPVTPPPSPPPGA